VDLPPHSVVFAPHAMKITLPSPMSFAVRLPAAMDGRSVFDSDNAYALRLGGVP
jgi:hypothetical protein